MSEDVGAKDLPVMFPEGIRFVPAQYDAGVTTRIPCKMKGWVFRRGRNNQWEAVAK